MWGPKLCTIGLVWIVVIFLVGGGISVVLLFLLLDVMSGVALVMYS